jgi:hypothetical protein
MRRACVRTRARRSDFAGRAGRRAGAALFVVFTCLLVGTTLRAQDAAGPLVPRNNSGGEHGTVTPAGAAATAGQTAGPTATSSASPEKISENAPDGAGEMLVVPSGTRLPLVLHNAITTRNAQTGDPLYFETVFPVVLNQRILVPAGSYVQGEVLEAKRPGRVKGRGEVRIRLTTMILPNGYTVKFDAVPTNAGTGGNESTDKEGQISGDTDKASDAGTVLKTTAAGAGIGAVAGRSATGAGVGAAAGAAAGIATVLLTRGPELELPRGTSLDIVLDRALYLDASKITFTEPGHASTLPGPANREPTRSKSPF